MVTRTAMRGKLRQVEVATQFQQLGGEARQLVQEGGGRKSGSRGKHTRCLTQSCEQKQ